VTAAPRAQYLKTSDGVNIAYSVAGQGPPIVHVASPAQSHVQLEWDQPIYRDGFEGWLAAGLMLVRYDTRGSGLSDRSTANISLRTLVYDLEAVVNKLQLDRFILLAVEFGAPAAIAYAAQHPAKVSRIVLINPVTVADFATRRGQVFFSTIDDWELFTETATALAFGFGFEGARQFAAFSQACVTGEAMTKFLAVAGEVGDLPGQVTTPTLVVRYTGHTWLAMEPTRALVADLKNAELVVIENTSGNNMDQQARAIGRFVAPELAGTAAAAPRERRSVARAAYQSSVRTVLFTDIVGHTEMMSRLGDTKGRDVLREHERITRATLKQHGGAEVKTMGDGFMASFGGVTSAMECAIALQRAFAAHTESMPEPLHVRVGLNAGEPIEEDGDLFGATVILASRIAAKAGAGEILVPDTVRGLLLGKGFVFGGRGEFVPKGFDEAVKLWDVSWQEQE
jgi:class 3 adenylate cyclase